MRKNSRKGYSLPPNFSSDSLECGDVVRNVSTVELLRNDPWSLPEIPLSDREWHWSELNRGEKARRAALVVCQCLGLLFFLYCFVCSLGLMSMAFRLMAGRVTGSIFQEVQLLRNPVVGVMIGVLSTVLLQSSSAFTSIVVSMVAAKVLTVEDAVPIIMGANIGTSVTNSVVSLTQMADVVIFRRAFAAAVIHDVFNWLNVLVLLPVELCTGYLSAVTGWIVAHVDDRRSHRAGGVKFLKALTDPLLNLIVQLDRDVIRAWTAGAASARLPELAAHANATSMIRRNCSDQPLPEEGAAPPTCSFLFARTEMTDRVVGGILLAASLVCLCLCLLSIVKLLLSMLKGYIAGVIKHVLNGELPYVPWLTGYVVILTGCVLTILVQSSSVFTSILTPFAGIGLISLERIYPLTLGANIGTTTTAIVASFASSDENFRPALQVALCHLVFNLTGVLLFYVVPKSRLPIRMARVLGETTSRYRWFPVAYVLVMFVLLPLCVFALSFGGPVVLGTVGAILATVLTAALVIGKLQKTRPQALPHTLRSWDFLPLWMRSLQPLDVCIRTLGCCRGHAPKDRPSLFGSPESERKAVAREMPRTQVEQSV